MTSKRLDIPVVLPHPAAPQSLAETGLTLDLLLQLTLKHMHFAGELTGSELAARLGLRFTAIEPAVQALKSQHQIEIVGGDDGRAGVVSIPNHRRRPNPSGDLSGAQSIRRLRAGPARAICGVPARLEERRASHSDAQPGPRRLSASCHRTTCARSARPGDQCRTLAVRLRPSWQRQVGHLTGDSQPARRRHRDSACAGGRRADRAAVRPRQPRCARRCPKATASQTMPRRTGGGCAAGARW